MTNIPRPLSNSLMAKQFPKDHQRPIKFGTNVKNSLNFSKGITAGKLNAINSKADTDKMPNDDVKAHYK
jgi:hypothetical protein